MIFLFLKEFKERWKEVFLASLVIGLVVSLVVVQNSLSAGSENAIHDYAHNLGNNMLVVPAEMELSDFYMFRYSSETFPEDYPERLQSSDIGGHIRLSESRLYGNIETNGVSVIVVGIVSSELEGRSASMPMAVIGGGIAENLQLREGSVFALGGISLKVAQVLNAGVDGIGSHVFVSLGTAQEILQKPGAINAMHLGGCWCSLDIPSLALKVEEILPGTRAVTKAGLIEAQKGMIGVMERYTGVFHTVALLLVGGVILFLILSQVRRYMREFGLLLAIGTSPGIIMLSFMVKAGITGMMGTILGFLLGIPLTMQVSSYLLGTAVAPSSGLLFPIMVLCLQISLATALIASARIAFLDPTKALRED